MRETTLTAAETACPACGAPIELLIGSSMVVVCKHCNSLVARGDRRLEDHGKVAALVETGTPLALDLKGRYRGTPFTLVGRTQYRHQAGGVWNEWYAAFANDRWGWLAEAQGKYYLTFARTPTNETVLPRLDEIQIGQRFTIPGVGKLLVAESGEADFVSAEGEIPFELRPGDKHRYADLSGGGGKFATIDYSDETPVIYTGEELTLDRLGIDPARLAEAEPREIEAVHLPCPNCGGSLDLRAPDEAQRVVCPFCSSMLDVEQGNLKFLKTLDPGKVKPLLDLGSTGRLDGLDYTVIGFLRRSVTFDMKYYWQEYLLYHPRRGFRWLVHSDNHWSFVRTVVPGEVEQTTLRGATYDGDQFRLFQNATATVESVLGEFYWKVEAGETVMTADYVAPPLILSREETHYLRTAEDALRDIANPLRVTGEVTWSVGKYMPVEEVEQAFGIKSLPRPTNVAPNQPFRHKGVYKAWGLLVLAALFGGLVLYMTAGRKTVYDRTHAMTTASGNQVVFDGPLEIGGFRNLHIMINPAASSALYVQGDLHNDQSGRVREFAVPVGYGETTDEQMGEVYLSAVPAGQYTLKLDVERMLPSDPLSLRVRIVEDDPQLIYFVYLLVGLSIVPLAVGVWHFSFEKRRWEDSDYSPYADWFSS
jgi:hypothetical protein